MIYFDAAATSFYKPAEVETAMIYALHHASSAGRGGHPLALAADRIVYTAREKTAKLFSCPAEYVCFSKNATESLNTLIFGLLSPADHVITTACEHNSVLRPLYLLSKAGMGLSILPVDSAGRMDYEKLPQLLQKNTRAVICTHASNVTGNVTDLTVMADFCHKNGLLLLVDAAQTAGHLPVNTNAGIDALAFTGHKGLLGPQGTGGLAFVKPLDIQQRIVGGSGVKSFSCLHPAEYPTRLEAGTQNVCGIAGLSAGIDFIQQIGIDAIHEKEERLTRRFYTQVREIPGVTVYGDFTAKVRTPIVSLNLLDLSSGELSAILAEEYGICTRHGAHCAPQIHMALGTKERGAVRFSFSYFNTEEQIDAGISALSHIAKEFST